MTDEKNIFSRAEEFMQLFKKGADFTQELLKENERLRFKVVQLEEERRLLSSGGGSDKAVAELNKKLQNLEQEMQKLLERYKAVEAENKDFANRYLEIEHENNNLACSDCHNPMANFSSTALLAGNSINETCFNCHQEQRAQFRRRSHMPLFEGKITCVDCHNPHGSITKALLKTDTVNQTCYQCHAEKRGPFLFEHAPVQDNCLHCHNPHGSNHEKLLVTARPMLCQQCHTHTDHMNDLFTRGQLATGSRPDARVMGRSCQNCHAQVHGSNHPSGAKLHR